MLPQTRDYDMCEIVCNICRRQERGCIQSKQCLYFATTKAGCGVPCLCYCKVSCNALNLNLCWPPYIIFTFKNSHWFVYNCVTFTKRQCKINKMPFPFLSSSSHCLIYH